MLICFGTLQDLHRLQIRLSEHERLTFWDRSDEEEDLEVDGRLVFDPASRIWQAEFQHDGIRYMPHRLEEEDSESFPCYKCRTELGSYIKAHGVHSDCPSCGLAIWFPLSPPEGAEDAAP